MTLALSATASAQTIGATLDFGGINQPWPITSPFSYAPFLPHNVRANNLPGGATSSSLANNATDVAYIAPTVGWVIFSGQVVDVIGAPISNGGSVLRIFKNSQPGTCADAVGVPPLMSFYGMGPDWSNVIPINGTDYAHAGDSYSFCLYLAAGNSENYVDGNQAHTRISIVELP